MSGPQIGVAHLTALACSPPELVELAAKVGFSSIGVRVHPATSTERRYPMLAPSAMLTETKRRLADTGVTVFDIEVFALEPALDRETWLPVLEAGAELGASVLNVVGADPDPVRFTDKLGRLVDDARGFGIRPSLEPISYQHVDTITKARQVAEASGAGIMLDTLHFVRAGGTLDQLRALPDGLVTVIQLCDGPAQTPGDLAVPEELPLGQSTNGSARQLESRAKRLLPGEGVFPLTEVLGIFPGVPISAEVPDVFAAGADGVEAHARRVYTASREVAGQAMLQSGARA
jgi:sugar phosphate isomerase/epimerase